MKINKAILKNQPPELCGKSYDILKIDADHAMIHLKDGPVVSLNDVHIVVEEVVDGRKIGTIIPPDTLTKPVEPEAKQADGLSERSFLPRRGRPRTS